MAGTVSVPLGLNIAEMVFDYLPGGDNFTGFTSPVKGLVNVPAYSGKGAFRMNSRHHGMRY